MKREIRVVDEARGLVQITSPDERWYSRQVSSDGTEENRTWDFVPSVTWITGYFPKDVRFFKYIASTGWDEAEIRKADAGNKGSKVHQACGVLMAGGTVMLEHSQFTNPRTMESEELTPAEYECLMSFKEWFDEMRPEIVAVEYVVWNEKYHYAGTVDLLVKIARKVKLKGGGSKTIVETWLIDLKTSPEIWPSFELQVSAYKHADSSLPRNVKLGILQLGYKRNKFKKWKFTEIKDQFPLFLSVRKIWAKETAGQRQMQKDYPLELRLDIPVVAAAA